MKDVSFAEKILLSTSKPGISTSTSESLWSISLSLSSMSYFLLLLESKFELNFNLFTLDAYLFPKDI